MSLKDMFTVRMSGLSDSTLVDVLEALAVCKNSKTGQCFPSTERIAFLSRRSVKVTRKALKQLTDLGYVSQTQNPGGKRFFSLHLEKLQGGEELQGEGMKIFTGTPCKSSRGGGAKVHPESGINQEVNQEDLPPPSPLAKREAQTHLFSLSEITDAWKDYIEAVRPDLDPKKVFTDFRFYWENGRGSSTRRSDKGWTQSWQTWVRREKEAQRREGGQRRGEEFRPGEEDTTGFRNLFR